MAQLLKVALVQHLDGHDIAPLARSAAEADADIVVTGIFEARKSEWFRWRDPA